MKRMQTPSDLNDTTERFKREALMRGCRSAGFVFRQPPLRVRIARKMRQFWTHIWMLVLFVLLASGRHFGPAPDEETLVAAEVEAAPVMARQQAKVERAQQIAEASR